MRDCGEKSTGQRIDRNPAFAIRLMAAAFIGRGARAGSHRDNKRPMRAISIWSRRSAAPVAALYKRFSGFDDM